MKTPRKTATRDRHRRSIRAGEPPCHLCGKPIDYSLPYLHPGEFVVDHVIPLNKGGADVIENKAAAHRSCNRAKSDRLDATTTTPPTTSLATSRRW